MNAGLADASGLEASGPASERIRIGGVPLDMVNLEGALDAIEGLVQARRGGRVFTPNVDHVVMAQSNPRFHQAYQSASLSLVDGMPVLWASHVLSRPLPAKVSGSDLIWPLMRRAAERGYRVYFLGGSPGVALAAKEKLERELPELRIVGVDESFVDVDAVPAEVVERIERARPDLLLLALGAPKQEIFAYELRERLGSAVAIGVGASLDFVAGVRKRAPAWVSRIGFEWLYRLLQEPRRLARRYLLRDPKFCWIIARQLISPKSGAS